MEGITNEEEVTLYYAIRAAHGPNITVVKDLGLCDNCLHLECPEHIGHDKWERFQAWKKQQQGQER